jgi:hypothetical protein
MDWDADQRLSLSCCAVAAEVCVEDSQLVGLFVRFCGTAAGSRYGAAKARQKVYGVWPRDGLRPEGSRLMMGDDETRLRPGKPSSPPAAVIVMSMATVVVIVGRLGRRGGLRHVNSSS